MPTPSELPASVTHRSLASLYSDLMEAADVTCTCTADGCDGEGDPGCTFCRLIDGELPCPMGAAEPPETQESRKQCAGANTLVPLDERSPAGDARCGQCGRTFHLLTNGGLPRHYDVSGSVDSMPMPGDDRAPGDSAPEERWKKAIDRVLNSGLMFPHMGEFWAYVDGEISWDEFNDRMSP